MPPRKQPEAAPRYEFTADAGVVMFNGRVRFQRDPELNTADGAKGYAFATSDEDVAGRLREVQKYGITEVSS
jgi:hypothetical protein